MAPSYMLVYVSVRCSGNAWSVRSTAQRMNHQPTDLLGYAHQKFRTTFVWPDMFGIYISLVNVKSKVLSMQHLYDGRSYLDQFHVNALYLVKSC